MNLEFTVEQQAFREQVRTWLTETLPPEFAVFAMVMCSTKLSRNSGTLC